MGMPLKCMCYLYGKYESFSKRTWPDFSKITDCPFRWAHCALVRHIWRYLSYYIDTTSSSEISSYNNITTSLKATLLFSGVLFCSFAMYIYSGTFSPKNLLSVSYAKIFANHWLISIFDHRPVCLHTKLLIYRFKFCVEHYCIYNAPSMGIGCKQRVFILLIPVAYSAYNLRCAVQNNSEIRYCIRLMQFMHSQNQGYWCIVRIQVTHGYHMYDLNYNWHTRSL